jgi:glycosyltransferase involved in cell wall biosynthesis
MSFERISILAVTSEVPWPLDSGGHLRTFHLLRALGRHASVRLVVPGVGSPERSGCQALVRAGIDPHFVAIGSRNVAAETARAAGAALRREPYVLFARHRHAAVAQALADEVTRRPPDVLYLDHLDSLVYADAAAEVPIVVDMHNVYSRLASRAATDAGGLLRRQYLTRESALLAGQERRATEVAHTILAVSDDEARYFAELGARHVAVVPNGVDCPAYHALPAGSRSGPPAILYVGSLAWPPNLSAARFLAFEALPAVRARVPDVRLILVGRDPSADLIALAKRDARVTIAGHVPDVVPYLREAHLLAVPLEAGGGTRLKILEAFAAGLPVAGTPIGCEGIGARSGDHLVVAGRDELPGAIVDLLNDPDRARRLALRARAFVRQRYDWTSVGALACAAVARAAGGRHLMIAASQLAGGPEAIAP